jgi:hypothetical protein
MVKSETYYFHQTPEELCKKLIQKVPLEDGDKVLEPFKGEGSFYNNLPDNVKKDWCEIEEGRDFQDYDADDIDWVISNPPFRLEIGNKRENSFFKILKYYTHKAKKGVALLGNDNCFSTLTPKRLKDFNDRGWFIHNIIVCSIKKWRGRYFFIILKKEPNMFYQFIEGSI